MKRPCLSNIAVATALVAGCDARAEAPDTDEMRAMIQFITQNSSLQYAGQDLPEVTVVSEDELQLLFRAAQVEASANDDSSLTPVSALYDSSENKIALTHESTVAGHALFHELVHFLQHINGKDELFTFHRVCLEAEAYELQALWQTENGIDLVSKPDYGFVMMLHGTCNDADFSWIDSAYTDTHKTGGR